MSTRRIDFCLLDDAAQFGSFFCRSAVRLMDTGMRVLVRCARADELAEISRQLWIYQSGFISHEIADADTPADSFSHRNAQLLLSCTAATLPCEALVNLSEDFPADHENYQHIVEIVKPGDETVGRARERFRLYKRDGLVPSFHAISARQ
ncbi:MAG: DNA polymerase III subunit chi [Gammaproteobacteria bacterium]|nr:DNA polymerase III subunit chi [Pseudomonadota bacterium]MCH9664161.1 DNA polymerase III subunit chi [Gammaproteobacteria bacterium]